MTTIDSEIRKTLSAEDERFLAEATGEEALFDQVMASFRGKRSWLVGIVMFWTFAFFVLGVWMGWIFFHAETTQMLARSGAALFFCMLAVAMLKSWYFAELNNAAVLRELKRLQLMIARGETR